MRSLRSDGGPRSVSVPIGWLVACLLVLGVAAGCGSDEASDGSAEALSISEPWARPTPPGSDRTAIYATIGNGAPEADRLTGVTTDRCSMTELHTTVIDDDGVAGMQPADDQALAVAAGADLVLEPGGLHVMCLGVTAPLAEDDTFGATFSFESGSTVEVEVEVADAQR